MFSFHARVHESVAAAALLAAGVTLHVLWIGNLLAVRIPAVRETFTLMPELGSASGLFCLAVAAYALVFFPAGVWFKGRDCSHARDPIFWFFIASVAAFALLTIPFVHGFGVAMEVA